MLNVEGVRETGFIKTDFGSANTGGANVYLNFGPLSEVPEIVHQMPAKEGRLPASNGEIVLTEGAADGAGLEVGDMFVWESFSSADFESGQNTMEFRVVGLVSGGNAFGTNIIEGFMTSSQFETMVESPAVSGLIVQLEDGADIETVRQAISADVAGRETDGPAMSVLTFDQHVDMQVQNLSQGSNQLVYALVCFALITMFAAGVVISNTFSITIAQRTRDIALMRAIGADAAQARGSLIQEALILGEFSSILGVVLGYVLVAAGSALLISDGLLAVSPWAIIVPLLLGIGVTLFAALGPSRMALAVRPLQALRQAGAPLESSLQVGFSRLAWSIVMALGGIVLLVGAAALSLMSSSPEIPLLIGMAGGALSFLGLLTGSPFLIPALVSILSKMTNRLIGMPSRIASANMQRSPRRTGTTAGALLIGVTLIAMMTVGAATVQATWTDVVNTQTPVDFDVRMSDISNDDASMPDEMLQYLTSIDGVSEVVSVQETTLTLETADGSGRAESTVVAIDPDQARAVSRAKGVFGSFESGTVLIPGSMAMGLSVKDGGKVYLSNGDRSLELTVTIVDMSNYEMYITPQDLASLAGDAITSGAWLRIEDNADVNEIVNAIPNGMPMGQSVDIEGSAHDRETYMVLVDQVLVVVMGLLAVAVVIAFVGVGNTLTLSVLERTRESGMLRALGLTVRQLHATLVIEGALISLVAGITGVVVGAFYGWVGALVLFGSSWNITFGFPVGRLLLVLVVSVLAGILASVLPARRSSSVSPVEALATV